MNNRDMMARAIQMWMDGVPDPVRNSSMCPVCMGWSGSGMGVHGVDGQWFCSMDCHDQHQCRRAADVWDGQNWQACRGPHGNIDVRCPDCDSRRNNPR